jgi:hypothetical protein
VGAALGPEQGEMRHKKWPGRRRWLAAAAVGSACRCELRSCAEEEDKAI